MYSQFPIQKSIADFLSTYGDEIMNRAILTLEIVLKHLPGVQEQVDLPARMIAYTYGPKYTDMVCTIIPSKKGLKLGFYKGNELPNPDALLEGTGKISRYVQIKNDDQINSPGMRKLLQCALQAYRSRQS